MLFYFVRHGQTDANLTGTLAGSGVDVCLNATGHAQASRLARSIRLLVPARPAKIVVSSMTRTRETAGYLAEEFGLPLELHAGWREWHLGEWEGQPFAEYGPQILGHGEPREGESRKTFYARVRDAWTDVHRDDEPYVVVSHGGVWLALQDQLEIPRFRADNCDLIKVWSEGGRWSAKTLLSPALD